MSHKLMKTVIIPKFGGQAAVLQTQGVEWKKHPRMVVFGKVSVTAFLAAVSKSIIHDSGVSTDWRSFTADFKMEKNLL